MEGNCRENCQEIRNHHIVIIMTRMEGNGRKLEGKWRESGRMQRKLPGNRSDLNRSQAAPPTWGQPSWRGDGCRIGSGFTLWIFARRELEHSHFQQVNHHIYHL